MGLFGKKKAKKEESKERLRQVSVGLQHIDDLSPADAKQPIPSWTPDLAEKNARECLPQQQLIESLDANKSDAYKMSARKGIEFFKNQKDELMKKMSETSRKEEVSKASSLKKNEIIQDAGAYAEKKTEVPEEIPAIDDSMINEIYDLSDIGIEEIEHMSHEDKSSMQQKGDLFVSMNSFKEIILANREIKNDAQDSKDFLERMSKIKEVTDSAVITLSNIVEDIERKLVFIDRELFGD